MGRRTETRVEKLATAYMMWCRRWEEHLRRWPRMWDQLEGTSASITANVGEALDSETLAQQRKYFGYAKASAGEGMKLVTGAKASGMLSADAADEGFRLLRDIRWDLIRLIRWTQR